MRKEAFASSLVFLIRSLENPFFRVEVEKVKPRLFETGFDLRPVGDWGFVGDLGDHFLAQVIEMKIVLRSKKLGDLAFDLHLFIGLSFPI